MAVKFVVDILRNDYEAWQKLLASDRALAHRMGVYAIAQEGGLFRPGISRSNFHLRDDEDHIALGRIQADEVLGYEPHVVSFSDVAYIVRAGRVACFFEYEFDVDIAAAYKQAQALAIAQQEIGETVLRDVGVGEQSPTLLESPAGSSKPEDTNVA